MTPCPDCSGTGTVLIELFHRQSFNIDSGYIEERVETCPDCSGTGEIEESEDE